MVYLQTVLDSFGVSRKEFAKDTGLSEAAVRCIIQGIVRNDNRKITRIPPPTLRKINQVLDKYQAEGRTAPENVTRIGPPRRVIKTLSASTPPNNY